MRIVHDESTGVTQPPQSIFDYSILYGLAVRDNSWIFTPSIGLSRTITSKRVLVRTDTIQDYPTKIYRSEEFNGFGLALQCQAFSTFSEKSDFGLGATLCVNINKSYSFFVLLLSLYFGNIN